MTEEMKRLRDKLAKEESEYLVNTLDQELADYCVRLGFDACYKEMQAQSCKLYKAYEARIDEVISERDALKESVDELKNEIRKWNELYILTSKQCDRTEKERDTLKQQLEVLEKNKKAMNSLIGLHSMKIDALEDQIKQREIAYDSAVKELRIHKDAQLETLLKDKKNE